ncbi:GNAT family N-acetyltransferase [Thioalkalicoccus limnaeus]|uniref:GNAT family N-acetyltransferase n=1 Tax=Thioalkalicoccus limnaeus TaxID=120681 RepID=UPI003F746F0C
MSLLEEIRRPVKDRLASDPGTCLHVSAVGVAPGYEGAGLATRLLQTALADAEAHGFLHAFAECTSPASRTLHQKCGFAHVQSVPVHRFSVDGRRPFMECPLDVHLMWRVFDGGQPKSRDAPR